MPGIGRDPWKKGHWTAEEDQRLIQMVHTYGEGQWNKLAHAAGLSRCGKSCRLRWVNYLRPGVKRGQISEAEECLIVQLHGIHGRRWSLIAAHLPGRSDNEIKNYWRSHIKKKLRGYFPPPQENEESQQGGGGSPKKVAIESDFDYLKESNSNSSSTPSSSSLNTSSIKPVVAPDEDITSFLSSSNSSSSFCYNGDDGGSGGGGGDDLLNWLPEFPHALSWDIESSLNISCPYFNGHHDHCLHLWSNGLF